MTHAFGHNFIILNDVIQVLDPDVFTGGPWLHLATVQRGLREYMAFKKTNSREVWIEIVDNQNQSLEKIEDDSEWEDVAAFLHEAKLLEVGLRRDLHLAKSALFV